MKTTSKRGSTQVMLVISLCALLIDYLPVAAGSWPGSGTELDPYLIQDANGLRAIAGETHSWDAHFKLMADIDLPDDPETNLAGTIGRWEDQPFTGVFDDNRCLESGGASRKESEQRCDKKLLRHREGYREV